MSDRELDARVAEKVMGLTLHAPQPAGFYEGEWHIFDPEGPMGDESLQPVYAGEDEPFAVIPFYSTSIADAFLVVEAMRAKGWEFGLCLSETLPNAEGSGWWWRAAFNRDDDDETWYSDARESAPEAICRAALQALGEDA